MEQPNYRHELKYLVTDAQMAVLRSRVSGLMPADPHAGADGRYDIRSLYFDDYDDRCFYENENGTDPREKFRIRIYDRSREHITLELKRKERGKTLKLSAPLTEQQTRQLMTGQPLPMQPLPMQPLLTHGADDTGQSALLRKLTLQMRERLLRPVVIVEYDRYPYIYRNGNVRVTFDTNVSSSSAISDFLLPQIPKRPVMPAGLQLLEVKFDEYLPDVIYRALQLENLQQTAYSKFYLCRRYGIR